MFYFEGDLIKISNRTFKTYPFAGSAILLSLSLFALVEVGKKPVPISSRGVESSKNPTVTNTSVVSHIDDIETLSDERMQIIKQFDNLQSIVDAQTLMLDRYLSFLQKIDRRVTTLTMSQGLDTDEGVNEWQANLPLTTVQEVDDAETRLLGDEAKKKQLVRFYIIVCRLQH